MAASFSVRRLGLQLTSSAWSHSPLLLRTAVPAFTAAMSSATSSDSGLDTYSEILIDHNNVKDLFARYKHEANPKTKEAIVNTIIREIAVHGEAEEVSVYNELEAKGKQGESQHFRHEHQELEEALYEVDKSNFGAPDFDQKLTKAISIFVNHGTEEEKDVFPDFVKKLTTEENHKLAEKFIEMRKLVPTHPHPSAPQHGKAIHKLTGAATRPLDKIFDLARDYVDLKYQHPAKPGDPGTQPQDIDPALLRA